MLKNILTIILLVTSAGCSMFGGGDGQKEPVEKTQESDGSFEGEISSSSKTSKTVQFGSTLIKSVSNNRLTSRTIKGRNAASLARSLGKNKKNLRDLIDAVAAERIAGTGERPVLARGKILMDRLFTKGIKQELPESVKLELGLAAVQQTNLALADYFLRPLLKGAKNPKVKAGAYNAYGVLYLKMNEMPDAVASFKQALGVSSNYPPALFNLGMLTAKYGDFGLAKKYLNSIQRDWYAQIGMVVAERHMKRDSAAQMLCNKLLNTKPKNKMALMNCGLFFAQNKGDKKKGRDLITRATQIPGGESDWDEKAFKALEKLN
jgi:Flp pilus assembly protein TadD